ASSTRRHPRQPRQDRARVPGWTSSATIPVPQQARLRVPAPATSLTTSCRSSAVGLTLRATCNGRPPERRKRRTGGSSEQAGNMRSKPRINASRCFLKAYATASPVIQRMAFRAIHDLVGRYRSDPRTCWRHYEKVAGLKESVKEVEIGYSQRMLVYPTPGGLTLLAVGGHDIVGSYGDGLLPSDLDTAECAPPEFWPDQKVGFFTREISYDVQPFTHTEYLPEWVYYLADEQDQAASDIMEGIEGLLTGDAHNPVRFTVGGPGTGKTCVLLSLLRRCQRMGISAQIAMPDAVLKYIQACTEFPSPAAYAGSPYEAIVQATSDVLLVDDPANLYEIRAAMHRVRAGDIRVAVFAFDPLQIARAP